MSTRTVLLTGANGFLGLHVLKQIFLHKYNAVAVVRSKSKAAQIERIAKEFPDQKLSVEEVPDITVDGAYDKVLEAHPEVTAIIHTASPLAGKGASIEDTLGPAVNGVTNILKATKAHAPQVDRFILTSSLVAIVSMDSTFKELLPPSNKITEKDWGTVEREDLTDPGFLTYSASKKFAEQALWNFIEQEKPNFTGTAINPSFLVGENLDESVKGQDAFSGSNGVVFGIGAGKFGQTGAKPIVGVRDTALAHVDAIENKKAIGQRWLITLQNTSHADVIEALGVTAVTEEGKNFRPVEYVDNRLTLEQFGHPLAGVKEIVDELLQTLHKHEAL